MTRHDIIKTKPNHIIGSIQFAYGKILAFTNFYNYEHKRYYHDTYHIECERCSHWSWPIMLIRAQLGGVGHFSIWSCLDSSQHLRRQYCCPTPVWQATINHDITLWWSWEENKNKIKAIKRNNLISLFGWMMMLMHVVWTMWVDRGQGGGCAPPACNGAQQSSIFWGSN